MLLTQENKNVSSLTLEGRVTSPTWDETTQTWDEMTETWDTQGTLWTEEAKNPVTLTLEPKL